LRLGRGRLRLRHGRIVAFWLSSGRHVGSELASLGRLVGLGRLGGAQARLGPRLPKIITQPLLEVADSVQDAARLQVPASLELHAGNDLLSAVRPCHLLVDGIPAGLDSFHVEGTAPDGELLEDRLRDRRHGGVWDQILQLVPQADGEEQHGERVEVEGLGVGVVAERRLRRTPRVERVFVERKSGRTRLAALDCIGEEVKGRDERSPDIHLSRSHAADARIRADSVAEGDVGVDQVSVRDAPRVKIEDGIREVGSQAELGFQLRLEVGTGQEISQRAQVVQRVLGQMLESDGVEGRRKLIDQAVSRVLRVFEVAEETRQPSPRTWGTLWLGLQPRPQLFEPGHGRRNSRGGEDGVEVCVLEQQRRVGLTAGGAVCQLRVSLLAHKHDLALGKCVSSLCHGLSLHRAQAGKGLGIDLLGCLHPRRLKSPGVLR